VVGVGSIAMCWAMLGDGYVVVAGGCIVSGEACLWPITAMPPRIRCMTPCDAVTLPVGKRLAACLCLDVAATRALLPPMCLIQIYTWPGGNVVRGFGWNANGAARLTMEVSPACKGYGVGRLQE
jgi:hypothetical protein